MNEFRCPVNDEPCEGQGTKEQCEQCVKMYPSPVLLLRQRAETAEARVRELETTLTAYRAAYDAAESRAMELEDHYFGEGGVCSCGCTSATGKVTP